MVECKKHKAKISESTCVARQRIIDKGYKKEGAFFTVATLYVMGCEGCKIGLDLYKKSKAAHDPTQKKCLRCKKDKPKKDGFYKNKTTKDGLHPYCKDCHKQVLKKAS